MTTAQINAFIVSTENRTARALGREADVTPVGSLFGDREAMRETSTPRSSSSVVRELPRRPIESVAIR